MYSTARLAIESLEPRRLFAGIVLSHHGFLLVAGSVYTANTIVVGLTPDQSAVTASISFDWRSTPFNITKTFPLTDHLRLVSIRGGLRADSITIDQTNGAFPFAARIAGGPGNDTIVGGNQPDTINGGPGNDSITAGNGHSVLLGGAGNDTLMAGTGADWMCGGPGRNSVVGGAGNDTLVSWHGGDTLMGGTGPDIFRTIGLRYSVNNYDSKKDVFQRLVLPSSGGSSFLDGFLNGFLVPF